MTLKEQLFQRDTITELADRIQHAYPSFAKDKFIDDCVQALPNLELKARMNHVADMLKQYLPNDFETTMDIFTNALEGVTEGKFIYGAILRYISQEGCNDEHVDLSLQKLGEFTQSFSAEFAIRTFLNAYPYKTLDYVKQWAESDNPHQRRLASEGTRPSLPWAEKVQIDYHDGAIALDTLYKDSERYVTRSVANHLNDISKLDPKFVLQKLFDWRASGEQNAKEMEYIIHHSLRTLIKSGYPEALTLIGYNGNPDITVSNITLTPNELHIGDTLNFLVMIKAHEDARLLIDYIITYPTKHGRTTQKVYKWKKLNVSEEQTYTISGRRKFEHLSTRTMRPGQHKIAIQINGDIFQEESFELYE